MLPVGFEPTIPAGERPQTQALDREATATDRNILTELKFNLCNTAFEESAIFNSMCSWAYFLCHMCTEISSSLDGEVCIETRPRTKRA
jgi:hypothetical protein